MSHLRLQILSLLCWPASIDARTIAKCPGAEQVFAVALGMCVAATSTMAGLLVYAAAGAVDVSSTTRALLGVLWGTTILLVDRLLLSTSTAGLGNDFKGLSIKVAIVAPRAVVLGVMAFLLTMPLEIAAFGDDLDQAHSERAAKEAKLHRQNDALVAELVKQVIANDANIVTIRDTATKLGAELTACTAEEGRLATLLEDELNGKGYTGIPGNGSAAKLRRSAWEGQKSICQLGRASHLQASESLEQTVRARTTQFTEQFSGTGNGTATGAPTRVFLLGKLKLLDDLIDGRVEQPHLVTAQAEMLKKLVGNANAGILSPPSVSDERPRAWLSATRYAFVILLFFFELLPVVAKVFAGRLRAYESLCELEVTVIASRASTLLEIEKKLNVLIVSIVETVCGTRPTGEAGLDLLSQLKERIRVILDVGAPTPVQEPQPPISKKNAGGAAVGSLIAIFIFTTNFMAGAETWRTFFDQVVRRMLGIQ